MTGYPAVQFFEKATVGGRVKGDIQRHWLGIQMGGNQAVGYGTVAKKDGFKLFSLNPSKVSINLMGLITREICSP
jgi:hypothetical protein